MMQQNASQFLGGTPEDQASQVMEAQTMENSTA